MWPIGFDKGAKALQWRKNSLLNKRWWDKKENQTEKLQLKPHTLYKNKLKWIIGGGGEGGSDTTKGKQATAQTWHRCIR